MKPKTSRLAELLESSFRKTAKLLEKHTDELLEELADEAEAEAHAQVDAFAKTLRKHTKR